MSCFESSTFAKNSDIMHQDILIKACEQLNWKYTLTNDELIIWKLNSGEELGGEYAMKVKDNKVTYNTYYVKNAKNRVVELQRVFFDLNIKYAEESIIREFKKAGYSYKSNSKFKVTEDERISFYMVGRSKLKDEKELLSQIKFTILKDGSIITDSNYIPEDIHELADKAMERLESTMGNKRVIKPKEIPLKYKNKAFCKSRETLKIKRK